MRSFDEAAVITAGDHEFEQIVLANISRRRRNSATWAALLAPDVIARTQATLVAALQRNASAMSRRSTNGCHHRARDCPTDPGQQAWRRRAADFGQIVEAALTEIKIQRRVIEAEADKLMRRRYREHLRFLATAIAAHQRDSYDAGLVAESHDQRLWDALDAVEVPYGRDGELLTLRQLTETHWGAKTDGHRAVDRA